MKIHDYEFHVTDLQVSQCIGVSILARLKVSTIYYKKNYF